MRHIVVGPEPGTRHRWTGGDDHVLLSQHLVGDRLVEVGGDHSADAVLLFLVDGETALHLQVGMGVVIGRQRVESGGSRKRHPAVAHAVDRHRVAAREVQTLRGLPGRAVGGKCARHGVAPVISQRDRGDFAVDDVDRGLGQGVDVLGAVEWRQAQQWRLRNRRRQLCLGGGRDRFAAFLAARKPRDVADQHSRQQRHEDEARGAGAAGKAHRITPRLVEGSDVTVDVQIIDIEPASPTPGGCQTDGP